MMDTQLGENMALPHCDLRRSLSPVTQVLAILVYIPTINCLRSENVQISVVDVNENKDEI